MAINDIYNSLTFGGINSLDYGVYISGPGVFDAPTRDVELVDVPGRNGAIEIDRGHWNNIEVRYTAGTFGDNQSDFAKNVNAFRNAIVSQLGYQRLTDTYNPEEYRLGIYSSGLEVSAVNYNQAGEFELVFNCKPQRFLLSGETSVPVSDGDTLTNPTLYPSSPLLSLRGNDGNIRFNNSEIHISEGYYGDIVFGEDITFDDSNNHTFDVPWLPANNEDLMRFEGLSFYGYETTATPYDSVSIRRASGAYGTASAWLSSDKKTVYFSISIDQSSMLEVPYDDGSFPDYIIAEDTAFNITVVRGGGSYTSPVFLQALYNGALVAEGSVDYNVTAKLQKATINSTRIALGNPTYIDTEIGEAYKIEGGKLIDLNKYVTLGSDLPKLAPGDNTITFDDTITDLEITPRWWEL